MGWGTGNIGSGSGGLNFKVVGGTSQPASPKENTIWVNTDTGITSYIFSITEPESPVDGMVWISTGTSSPVGFNALKKNGIQVYPISAKQYISGAWTDVTAKSYQGGEWVYWWNGEIYTNGFEWTEHTGGIEYTDNGYVIKGDKYITFTNSVGYGSVFTSNKMDLSGFNTLCAEIKGASSYNVSPNITLGYGPEKECESFTGMTKIQDASGDYIHTCDISAAKDLFYIQLFGYMESFTVHRIWME